MDEADLIARVVLADDHHAFAQLVRAHQSPLRLYLRRLTCGDDALADDLAQETFLRAYRKLAAFRNESRFRTWLFGIATHLFRSEARKTTWRAGELEARAAAPEDAPSPERLSLAREVVAALAWLAPDERVALALCSGVGLSHAEAAAVMECPVGTVKTHVLRGKARLRERLAGPGNEEAT